MPSIEEYMQMQRIAGSMHEAGQMLQIQSQFIHDVNEELIDSLEEEENEFNEAMEGPFADPLETDLLGPMGDAMGMPDIRKSLLIMKLKKKPSRVNPRRFPEELDPRPENPNWPGSYFERSLLTL